LASVELGLVAEDLNPGARSGMSTEVLSSTFVDPALSIGVSILASMDPGLDIGDPSLGIEDLN